MLVEMVYTTAYSNITISIIVTIVGDSSTSSELIQKMETHNAATVAGEDMHLAPTLHFYPGGRPGTGSGLSPPIRDPSSPVAATFDLQLHQRAGDKSAGKITITEKIQILILSRRGKCFGYNNQCKENLKYRVQIPNNSKLVVQFKTLCI